MIANYTKTALRNFRKNPLYLLVNVLGLSAGLTFMLLMVLYVKNELSFDNFHDKGPQLYRLTTTITDKNDITTTTGSSGQVQGPAFKQAIPEIQDYARLWNVGGFNIIGQSKAFWLTGLFADSSFFRVLSFPAIHGNTSSALNDPYSLVITASTAMKYFGKSDVVGKTLDIEEHKGFETLTIRAVIKDPPPNSSLQFEAILSFQFLETFFKDNDWFNAYLSTFVLMQPNANPQAAEKKFDNVMRQQAGTQFAELEKNRGIKKISFALQPVKDIHLSGGKNGNQGDIYHSNTYLTIYILSGIAVFILVMACINFVNLTIANSLKRAREIGVRKINGGTRAQIITQFLTEATLLCIAAFALAVLFTNLLLPVFNSLTERKLEFSVAAVGEIWLLCMALLAVSILLAGVYPAWVLSNFKAASVLYDKLKFRATGVLGKSLVVLQFTIAITLIVITLVYYLQMRFVTKRELGYNPSSLIEVKLPPQRNPDHLVRMLQQQLAAEPSIKWVAGTNYWGSEHAIIANGKPMEALMMRADEHYIPALEIPIKEGRNFSVDFATDSQRSVIVNESFVKAAGWITPLGQQVKLPGEWEGEATMNIVGVVKDYHHHSLKEKIGPQIFVMRHYEKVLIKVQEGKFAQALAAVRKSYAQQIPDSPFLFTALDESIQQEYKSERLWQRIVTYASVVSLMICCLGLFGLSGIATRQRIREIGIRKVLGAGIGNIAGVLSKDFVKLVVIAFFIAAPISWMLAHKWLMNFAYTISLSWWIFFVAGLLATCIALATVGIQTLKAALGNPVKALRTE